MLPLVGIWADAAADSIKRVNAIVLNLRTERSSSLLKFVNNPLRNTLDARSLELVVEFIPILTRSNISSIFHSLETPHKGRAIKMEEMKKRRTTHCEVQMQSFLQHDEESNVKLKMDVCEIEDVTVIRC